MPVDNRTIRIDIPPSPNESFNMWRRIKTNFRSAVGGVKKLISGLSLFTAPHSYDEYETDKFQNRYPRF